MARITARTGLRSIEDVERAMHELADQVTRELDGDTVRAVSITKLPRALPANQLIVVTDATAGRVLCLSDGAQWLELQPVGVVS